MNKSPIIRVRQLTKTYRAGESFSEFPGDHHAVSENASKIEPARLLAVFVVDTDEKNLTIDDKN